MLRTVQNLINEVGVAYRDGYMRRSYDKLDDASSMKGKELLATFIAATIEDLHDVSSSDEVNLPRITTGLQFTIDDLMAVIRRLQALPRGES